jgi:hypothetical protein
MTVKRPCVNCGKECAEHHRNTDGTYTHDHCAKALAHANGWDRPRSVLASPRAEKEGT